MVRLVGTISCAFALLASGQDIFYGGAQQSRGSSPQRGPQPLPQHQPQYQQPQGAQQPDNARMHHQEAYQPQHQPQYQQRQGVQQPDNARVHQQWHQAAYQQPPGVSQQAYQQPHHPASYQQPYPKSYQQPQPPTYQQPQSTSYQQPQLPSYQQPYPPSHQHAQHPPYQQPQFSTQQQNQRMPRDNQYRTTVKRDANQDSMYPLNTGQAAWDGSFKTGMAVFAQNSMDFGDVVVEQGAKGQIVSQKDEPLLVKWEGIGERPAAPSQIAPAVEDFYFPKPKRNPEQQVTSKRDAEGLEPLKLL